MTQANITKEVVDKEYRDAVQRKKLLEEVTSCDGYNIIKTLTTNQVQARKNSLIYDRIKDGTSLYEIEYMKGEIAGLELVLKLVDKIIESDKITIDDYLKRYAEENLDD